MCLAAAVYAEQLLPKGHGYPLWIPEPDTAEATVRIGDVGYIWEGSFCTLFNATLPATHPVNRNGVPDSFVPLGYNQAELVRTRDGYLPDAPVCSQTVRRLSAAARAGTSSSLTPVGAQTHLSFECARNKGGLLVVNGGGAIQEILRPNKTFPEYMLTYHDTWCEFARERGHDVAPEDIVMVRGTVKSSEWTVAAFMDETRHQSLELEAQGGMIGSAGLSLTISASSSMSVEHRAGRSQRTTILANDSSSSRDQCLFLCRYRMLYRKWLWKNRKIKAEGYRDDEPSSDSDSEDDTSTEGDSEGEDDDDVVEDDCTDVKVSDPLDTLLEYILENSGCDVAIASDEDVKQLADLNVVTTTIGSHFAEQLRAACPRVEVSADGAGHLAIRALDTLDIDALDFKDFNIVKPSEVLHNGQKYKIESLMPEYPPPSYDLAGNNFAAYFANPYPTHELTMLTPPVSNNYIPTHDIWYGLSPPTPPCPPTSTSHVPYPDHVWSLPSLPPFTPYPLLSEFNPDGCSPSMHTTWMDSCGVRLTDTLVDTESLRNPPIRVASRPTLSREHDRQSSHDSRAQPPRSWRRLKFTTDEHDYNASQDSRIGYSKNHRPTRRVRFQNADGSIPTAVDVMHSRLRGLDQGSNVEPLSLTDSASIVRSYASPVRLNLSCAIWQSAKPMDRNYSTTSREFVCSMDLDSDFSCTAVRPPSRDEVLRHLADGVKEFLKYVQDNPPKESGDNALELGLRSIQMEYLYLVGLDRISDDVWRAEIYYCPRPLAVGHPRSQRTLRVRCWAFLFCLVLFAILLSVMFFFLDS